MRTYAERTRVARPRPEQPWREEQLAALYDAFPFDADIPLYVDLAAIQGGTVLEVASGTGRVLLPLARAGNRVTGIDASPAMLAQARRKLEEAASEVASRVQLVEADMRTFELPGQFDLAIIAAKSFAYLIERTDQERTLAQIVQHLRPGGLVALDLLLPSPAWLAREPGTVHQDVAGYVAGMGATVLRTETTVSTDLARQVRVIRSVYEIIGDDGGVRKRVVEWPYRYLHRFEAEHLLERAGLEVESIYGGYAREPLESGSPLMLFLARKP